MRASFVCVLALVAAGCFTPDLGDGAVACGTNDLCPPNYHCHASDHHCYKMPDVAVDMSIPEDLFGVIVDLASSDLAGADMSCTKAPCGARNCGMIIDGCGSVESCGGPCPSMQTCGGGNAATRMPNVCASGQQCTPKSCQTGNCGLLSNGCDAVLDCGPCSGGKFCGTDNFCH